MTGVVLLLALMGGLGIVGLALLIDGPDWPEDDLP